MQDFSVWLGCLMEILEEDVEAAFALIRAHAVSALAVVHLPEEDLSSLDALYYARMFLDLGQAECAEELLRDIVRAELGVAASAA